MGGQPSTTRKLTLENIEVGDATGIEDHAHVAQQVEHPTSQIDFSDGVVNHKKENTDPASGINFTNEVLERLGRSKKATAVHDVNASEEDREKTLANDLQRRQEKLKFAIESEFKKAMREIKILSKKKSNALCTFETY